MVYAWRETPAGDRLHILLERLREILLSASPMEETMMLQRRRLLHSYRSLTSPEVARRYARDLSTWLDDLRSWSRTFSRCRGRVRFLADVAATIAQRNLVLAQDPIMKVYRVHHLQHPFLDAIWLFEDGWRNYIEVPERFAARFRDFQESMASLLFELQESQMLGLTIPRRSAQVLLQNLEKIRFPVPTDSVCPPALRQTMEMCRNEVLLPCLATFRAYLEGVDRSTLGLSEVPGGVEGYMRCIRFHTGLDWTPDQVVAYGMAEVRRLRQKLARFPSARRPRSLGSWRDAKAYFLSVMATHRKRLSGLFLDPPGSQEPLPEVLPVPVREQAGAIAAAYDGRILLHPPLLDRDEVDVLALHEGWPGHHLHAQWISSLARQYGDVFELDVPTDTAEGWGLYVESFVPRDSTAHVSQLRAELFRAVRLVVDVSMHVRGWDEARCIAYMKRVLPWMSQGDIESEVLRYAVLPGQALSYALGVRAIREMRDAYLRRGGSLSGFHRWFLEHSVAPTTVLLRWIPVHVR